MELMQIKDRKDQYYEQFVHLYQTSFPPEEQNPLSVMFHLSKKHKFFIYAIVDNDTFIGLVVIACGKKWNLLNYLAIEPSLQGKGYGSKICQLIQQRYKDKPLVIEVEQNKSDDPNNEKQRRLDFYIRNHFTYSKLATSLYGVSYELLTNKTPLTYREYLEMYVEIFGSIKVKFLKIFPIESMKKDSDL